MCIECRIPTGFKQIYHAPGQTEKWACPQIDLYLPPANAQREPGTNMGTVWTAEGFAKVQIELLK